MPVEIPHSDYAVSVKIIDTGCRIHMSPSTFMVPPIHGHDDLACPAYSFLVENERLGRKIVFDLGVKKDWEQLPKPFLDSISKAGATFDRGKDVYEVLRDGGVELRGIESVIWRCVKPSQCTVPFGKILGVLDTKRKVITTLTIQEHRLDFIQRR